MWPRTTFVVAIGSIGSAVLLQRMAKRYGKPTLRRLHEVELHLFSAKVQEVHQFDQGVILAEDGGEILVSFDGHLKSVPDDLSEFFSTVRLDDVDLQTDQDYVPLRGSRLVKTLILRVRRDANGLRTDRRMVVQVVSTSLDEAWGHLHMIRRGVVALRPPSRRVIRYFAKGDDLSGWTPPEIKNFSTDVIVDEQLGPTDQAVDPELEDPDEYLYPSD